jgi:hypothetical protein
MPHSRTVQKKWEWHKIKKMSDQNKYTCNEYRQEMILLSLRLRLNKENLPELEKEKIQYEIQKLETAMDMT